MIYKWLNGMFLYQMQPFLFLNRMDVFTWVFMQTHLHQWLLNNRPGEILMDALFYAMPLIYFIIYKWKIKFSTAVCLLMLAINWCYAECYTLYPTNSIEGHIAWLLFPVIFLADNEKTFRLLFEALRYFFLFYFFSAGIWKIVQGGLFNIQQMSGVLLFQHKEMLINSPEYWQSKLIRYLIDHYIFSYILYLLSALIELSFITGFFTKKYDRLLAAVFILFLIMDYFIMRIPYFEVLPFLITLLYTNNKTARSLN